jgi:DNA polymerase sigma
MACSRLCHDAQSVVDWLKPTPEESEARELVYQRLNVVILSEFPGTKLRRYGSYCLGIGTFSS